MLKRWEALNRGERPMLADVGGRKAIVCVCGYRLPCHCSKCAACGQRYKLTNLGKGIVGVKVVPFEEEGE